MAKEITHNSRQEQNQHVPGQDAPATYQAITIDVLYLSIQPLQAGIYIDKCKTNSHTFSVIFSICLRQEGIESSKRVYQKNTNQHAPEENEPSDAPLPLKFAHFTSQYTTLIAEVCYTELTTKPGKLVVAVVAKRGCTSDAIIKIQYTPLK